MQKKHVRAVQSMSRAKRGRSQNSRPTIGLLIVNVIQSWERMQWWGVVDAAQQYGVNLICFPGRELHSTFGFDAQANVLYDLVDAGRVDGLMLVTASFANYINQEQLAKFCAQYHPLPLVCIEDAVAGIPSVLLDNYQAMREAMVHLVEVHGYKRIAYITSATVGRFGLEERYRAYTETLADYGIPFDPNLVSPPPATVGAAAIEYRNWLLGGRAAGWDALVGHADWAILNAMQTFQSQGIRIPNDMAVAGFGDTAESSVTTPPLTAVRPPFYEMGWKAVEMLMALIEGKEVPERVVVPSSLMIRQSCGCLNPMVTQAAIGVVEVRNESLESVLTTRREQIVAALAQAAGQSSQNINGDLEEHLLDSFVGDLTGESSGAFLPALDAALRQVTTGGGQVLGWQGAVSALRQQVLPFLDGSALRRAEDLCQQARVMIGEMAQRTQAQLRLQAAQQAQVLQEISTALVTTFDMKELMDVLVEELPRLGFQSCYIALYENPRQFAEWSRLIFAYNENGRIELELGGRRFRSRELAPEDVWPHERQFKYVVEPLYFQRNQLGFVLFELGPREGMVYETLRTQITSALQGATLVQREERRSTQLQTAAEVSRATSSILDLDELLSQTVELIRDRFGLYYAGLFLVDRTGERTGEPGKWAVLRAGTGEAGQQMLAADHKLEVGGASMVGGCIANRQARIALDVGEEAVRFSNPLLPHTRSELALPLVSQGQVIGAMTAQSDLPAAFTQEDIATLQSLADQLANATANARLFAEHKQVEEALARERNLLRALIDSIPDRIYAKDTESRFIICNLALARRMNKISPDELVGKSDFDLVPRELAERFYADEQAIIRSGQPLFNREEPLEVIDGKTTRWNLATKVPLRDSRGNIVGIVGLGREITDLKQSQLKLERSALQLQTAAEVSRVTSSILNLDELLSQTVELIRDRFGLYYTGLFLVDQMAERADGSGRQAVLRAGTGEAGRQMLAAGHKLEVGESSMVGWCIANQQARIAQNVGEEAIHFDNPFLPATRSELALPLISRGNAIGAMTVQSDQPAAFSKEDITVLQTIADQVANAIENTRLFGQAQAAVREMEVTQQRYIEQAWSSYVQSAVGLYHETTHSGMAPIGSVLLPEMQQAIEQKHALTLGGSHQPLDTASASDTHAALVAPVMLRGQVIGVLGVQDQDTTRQWSDEEVTLIQTVSERLAQVLENLRLFEDAQRRAARERTIGEVTGRIRESLDIETVLRTTASEIRQALDLDTLVIRLATPETDDASGPV